MTARKPEADLAVTALRGVLSYRCRTCSSDPAILRVTRQADRLLSNLMADLTCYEYQEGHEHDHANCRISLWNAVNR